MFIIVDSSKFDELNAADELTFIGAVVVSFVLVVVLFATVLLIFVFSDVFDSVLEFVFVLLPYTVLSAEVFLEVFDVEFERFISILLADTAVVSSAINIRKIDNVNVFLKFLFIIIITSNFNLMCIVFV